MAVERARTRSRVTGGVAIGIVGLLAALAVAFGNATGTQKAAENAVMAQQVESALGSIAAFRISAGQALLVAEASPESPAVGVLVDDARLLSAQMELRLADAADHLGEAAPGLDASGVIDKAESLLISLESGDLDGAAAGAAGLAAEIDDLETGLIGLRADLLAELTGAGQQAGRVATAARFMVALGIPGAALLSWAALARRRRRGARMEAALERERELNRSKDQMIANISHELRTPLTSIYAAGLTIAQSGGEDPGLLRELNGLVVEQSAELKRMVEDLLVSAQADAERLVIVMQEVDAREAIREIASEFSRTGTEVETGCEGGSVAADPLRLRQILRNLVSNARTHGGDNIRVEGRTDGARFLFTVIDDGKGVPPDLADRLFTPFIHRGDRPLVTGSVGLGLSITQILAEAMGGSISYERAEGQTRFSVDLARPPADPLPDEPDELLANEETAAVVEDRQD